MGQAEMDAATIAQLVIQGGSGLVALYMALQLKRGLDNHEVRITTLETNDGVSGTRSRRRKPRR